MCMIDWGADACSSDLDPPDPAARPRTEGTHPHALADEGLLHVEAVDIELVVVLGVGDRRLQRLLHGVGDPALGEGQRRDRLRRVEAADGRRHQVQLLRTDPKVMYAGASLLSSSEHPSELQSLMRISYAVFCLNKNKTNKSRPQQIKQLY